MSRSANPTAVGSFVIGAAALVVAAFAYFGSVSFGSKNRAGFVTFFRESAEGLQIGSEVTFKGVPVGRVKRILIRFEDMETEQATITSMPTGTSVIPVIYEIDTDRVIQDLGVSLHVDDPAFHHAQVKRGLRAKLKTSSFITGLLHLDLDYYGDAGAPPQALESSIAGQTYNVVPPIASDLTALKDEAYGAIQRFAKIDFESLTESFTELAKAGKAKVDALDIEKFNEAVDSLDKLVSSPKIGGALDNVGTAATKIGDAAEGLEEQVAAWEVEKLVADAREAVTEIQRAAAEARALVAKNSTTRQELDRSLTEFADASREVEELAAYLKQHPNSLIFGRRDKSGNRESKERRQMPGSKVR